MALAIALALALGAEPDPVYLKAAEAASRCDQSAYEGAIGQLEDDALQAMKAANEAVARAAAARGEVGAAGDADWARYKSLMSSAQRARVEGARRLAACSPQGGAVAIIAPSLSSNGALSEPGPRRWGDHFHLGVSTSHDELHTRSDVVIPRVIETGLYVVTSPSPTGPITYPGGSFTGLTPFQGPTFTPGPGSVRLNSRGESNAIAGRFGFAPTGWSDGWRFGAEVALSRGFQKEDLGGPLIAPPPDIQTSATPTVSCVLSSAFTGSCFRYGLGVPFSRTIFATPGSFNSPYQTEVDVYDVRQRSNQFTLALTADRAFTFRSPLGPLTAVAGVGVTGAWWSLAEDRTIAALQEGPQTAFVTRIHTSGEGPTFGAQIEGGLEGGMPWLPVRWSLSGQAEQEWAQLSLHGPGGVGAVVSRARTITSYGAALIYPVSHYRFGLGVERVRVLSAATHLAPGGDGGGVTLNDAMGTTVRIVDAPAWRYRFSFEDVF